jgi:hypothetical protein
MNKQKRKFTEEEIFSKIDEWKEEEFGDRVSEKSVSVLWLEQLGKLKGKFRTAQGFRRVIERAGLVGEKFE